MTNNVVHRSLRVDTLSLHYCAFHSHLDSTSLNFESDDLWYAVAAVEWQQSTISICKIEISHKFDVTSAVKEKDPYIAAKLNARHHSGQIFLFFWMKRESYLATNVVSLELAPTSVAVWGPVSSSVTWTGAPRQMRSGKKSPNGKKEIGGRNGERDFRSHKSRKRWSVSSVRGCWCK